MEVLDIYARMTSEAQALSVPGGCLKSKPHHAKYLFAPSPLPRNLSSCHWKAVCRSPCHVAVVFTMSVHISKASNSLQSDLDCWSYGNRDGMPRPVLGTVPTASPSAFPGKLRPALHPKPPSERLPTALLAAGGLQLQPALQHACLKHGGGPLHDLIGLQTLYSRSSPDEQVRNSTWPMSWVE